MTKFDIPSMTRRGQLYLYYIKAIYKNETWRNQVKSAVRENDFGRFRRVTGNFVSEIEKSRCVPDTRLPGIEWAYVIFVLWKTVGGKAADCLTSVGTLEAEYKILVQYRAGPPSTTIDLFADEDDPKPVEVALDRLLAGIGNDETESEIKENTMNEKTCGSTPTFPAFETRAFIYGREVTTMTEPELIQALKRVDAEIADLEPVATASKKIKKMISNLNNAKNEIIKVLDDK